MSDEKRQDMDFRGNNRRQTAHPVCITNEMKCCVSTATEYGKSVLGENEGIRVIPGRMDQSKMRAFIRENNIGLAVDATHPFVKTSYRNIATACEEEKIKYVRCLRERETNDPADHAGETSDGRPISAASVEEAVEYLKKTGGNVLISTGAKNCICIPG